MMEKSLQTYGGTQGDISPALTRDIHNGSLSNHIFPPSPGLGQIRLCSCIIVKESVTENAYIVL